MTSFARPQPSRLPPLGPERIPLAPFLRAEGDGRRANTYAQFHLTASVRDIGAFLDDANHSVKLAGRIELAPNLLGSAPVKAEVKSAVMSLLVGTAQDRRLMIYEIPFEHEDESWVLAGQKEIEDDPGFDAWLDASTLYVELRKAKVDQFESVANKGARPRTTIARGILRLGLADFAKHQLQGLHALGIEDPARVLWTLGSFGVFFFGQLQGAYAPEIDRFLSLFGGAAWRSSTVGARRADNGVLRILRGL